MSGNFDTDLDHLLQLRTTLTLAQVTANQCGTETDRRYRNKAADRYEEFYAEFVNKYRNSGA